VNQATRYEKSLPIISSEAATTATPTEAISRANTNIDRAATTRKAGHA
jgi:hypothetical protein